MISLRRPLAALAFGAALALAPAAGAQEHGAPVSTQGPETQGERAAERGAHGAGGAVDIITPHITDSYELELPRLGVPAAREVCIGRHLPNGHCGPLWDDVGRLSLGPLGSIDVNLSPTKHVVMLLLAATLCAVVLIGAARAHARHSHATGTPKGFAAGIEAMVLYIRNEVILPNVGHHGNAYVPYLLSLFFFILFANLLGLIPYGSTATGNVSVTAALAIVTFIVVEISGIRAQGAGYLSTLFYWNKDLPLIMRVVMFVIMSPVEMLGKLTKPFALTIRLFANMTAGHIVVLAFIGLIFTFGSYLIGLAPLAMAVAIMLLEIFVAFLQAFIFTLLSSVFIGQIREAHH